MEYIELLEKLACYEKEQLLNYNEALVLQKEILELKQKVYPKNHLSIGDTFNDIGLVYFVLGQFDSAIKNHEQALEIKLKSEPINEPSIAEIQNNLAIAYFHLGDTTKAMNLLKQAMNIYQNLSKDCMGYANTLHSYARVKRFIGEKNEAKKYFEEALEMKRKIFDENHSSIATTLHSLGCVYLDLGDKNKTKEYTINDFQFWEYST